MEYRQLTFDDWINIKENLRKQLQDVSEAFVRIGYRLKQIKEQRLYERDGYKDLATFAKEEYGLSATTVSRFMAINTKYSLGGNSELLRPEYVGIGSSKLGEMLTIKDEDMALIGPATTRESIRELKRFEKDEKKAGAAEVSDRESILFKITEEFFRSQPELLNRFCSDGPTEPIEELINPSGNRTFRTGIYFVSFFDTDKGIKVKAFGQNKPESYTWDEFEYAIDNIFEPFGVHTWAKHYDPDSLLRKEEEVERLGESSGDIGGADEHSGQGVEQDNRSDNGNSKPDKEDHRTDLPEAEPAGEPETVQSLPEADLDESPSGSQVLDHTKDEPEEIQPEDTEVVEKEIAPAQKYGLDTSATEESDPAKKTRMTRKKYLESMSAYMMAKYLSSHLSTSTLKNITDLTTWLLDKVEV